MTTLAFLMRNPVQGKTIEYNDNRLSLYCGQGGKCANHFPMERRVMGNYHARCGTGEKVEITSKFYLSSFFRYEYSANFFYKLFKRLRKYNGFITGMTQNVDEVLRSDTARLMLANSEFLVMLNQAVTDRAELSKLLNISANQLSFLTNVEAGSGLQQFKKIGVHRNHPLRCMRLHVGISTILTIN